jgi:MYXO-CTERM domain-containing protein
MMFAARPAYADLIVVDDDASPLKPTSGSGWGHKPKPDEAEPEQAEPEETETEPEETEPEETETGQTEPEQTEPEQPEPAQTEPTETEPTETEPEPQETAEKAKGCSVSGEVSTLAPTLLGVLLLGFIRRRRR